MSIKGYTESSLLSSEVFQGINDSMKIADKAKNLIKNSQHLTNEDIESAYIAIKQITDTLTRESLKAFDDQRIVLVYNNVAKLSMSQAVPFLTFNVGGDYKTFVFVDKYVTISREGVISISPSVLRDLLTSALVANAIKRNYESLSNNQFLAELLMNIYTKLFCRIINREYSIASLKVEFDTIQYWINRYFLEVVYGIVDTPENIEILASKHVKYLDEVQMSTMKETYDRADTTNLSGLLNVLKEYSPRMKTLEIGLFLNSWINYYYIPSMLACDNIEYLIFMCITLMSGNNIINIGAGDIVKDAKGIKNFRSELLKLIQ